MATMTKNSKDLLCSSGSLWTQKEEKLLYERTAQGLSLKEIAQYHKRTVGGIRARQKRLGLRDEETGQLLDPLPEFQPFSKEDIKLKLNKKNSNEIKNNYSEYCISEISKLIFKKSGTESTVDLIWAAIQWDVFIYFDSKKLEIFLERNKEIILARLTPDNDEFPYKTLQQLGEKFSITRERVRQIQNKIFRRFRHPKRKFCQTLDYVLNQLLSDNSYDTFEAECAWLSQELLHSESAKHFNSHVLRALYHRHEKSNLSLENLLNILSQNITAQQQQRHLENRRLFVKEVSIQFANKADSFVKNILSKAQFSCTFAADIIELSSLSPLRTCKGNRQIFVKTLKRMVAYESSGEKKFIKAFDRCQIIDQFAEQAIRVPYFEDGRAHNYIPDLIIRTIEGLVFVIEVKSRLRLADRAVQLKAKAAVEYLGTKGIGYCLVDVEGFSANDLQQVEVDEELKIFLRRCLREKGIIRYRDIKNYINGGPVRDTMDQVQSLVLRYNLNYQTTLFPLPGKENKYRFDFKLKI